VLLGQGSKVGLLGEHPLFELNQLRACLGLAQARTGHQQNVTRPALCHRRSRGTQHHPLNDFKHVKTRRRPHQRRDITHPEPLCCLNKQLRVSTDRAQPQLPAICNIRRFRKLTHQRCKILSVFGPVKRPLRPCA